MMGRFTKFSIIKNKALWLICFLVLFFLSFLSFDLTISPERKFKVVDQNGKPILRARVQHIWDQYSLRCSDEERLLTDSEGFVILHRRGVKTSWFSLIKGAIGKFAEYTIHASITSSDTVLIDAFGYKPESFFDGEGLGDTVVLKKQ
jgi:hypothetical protein